MDVKSMTSEELADVIRTMHTTGLAPTRFEKECLAEAAERLEKLDRVEKWINKESEYMDKLQAIRIIKSAINTLKKGIQAESIEEKQSVLTMFEAFSGQIEQAFETLEKE